MNALDLWYWVLRLALPLLVVAAALPWIARIRSKPLRRFAALALVALTLLPNLAAGLDCAWLHFVNGLEACPWLASGSVMVAQIAGSVLLLRKAKREPGAIDWPSLPLGMAATVALVLAWTVHVNLDLRLRLSGAQLELEAGRIAYREGLPPPTPETNAAPIYTELGAQLVEAGGTLDADRWSAALNPKEALDAGSKELRAALAQSAPALARLMEATELPRCSFEPEDGSELFPCPPISMMLNLSRALVLDARVSAEDGDFGGALEELSAVLRLAEHIGQKPLLITGLAAVVARELAIDALPQILAAPRLRGEDLANLTFPPRPEAAEIYRSSTAAEVGYMLSGLGRALGTYPNEMSPITSHVHRFLRPGRDLAMRFYLDEQVAGYRRTMVRCGEVCDLDPVEFAARCEAQEIARAVHIYADGLFAPFLSPKLTSLWIPLRRGECKSALARAAFAAAAYRLEHGRYPVKAEELPQLPALVRWEGDASFARFVAADPLLEEDQPSMELPPRN